MSTTNAPATASAGASTNASAIAATTASGATSCSAAGRSSGDTAEPMDTSCASGSGSGSGGVSVAAAEADEGQCCTICFDTWSNSGSHRIASLRCGHLFGLSCIERWLRGREQRCPHCNEKASVRDIRAVFAKSVRVLDTSERDRALSELNAEKERRRKLELDYSIIKLKCRMQETEIVRLQRELYTLRRSVARGSDTCLSVNGHNSGQSCSTRDDTLSLSAAAASATTSSYSAAGVASAADPLLSMSGVPSLLPSQQQLQLETDRWSLALQASVNVARSGGCRVMRHSHWLQLLAVSQPSQSHLFPGYGVRKVNTLDMRPAQYVALHNKQVRDLAFQPQQRDMLLSVALDGRAVLTNVSAGARVQTWTTGAPCWSCAWDRRRQYCCYVGLSSGAVMAVDWRRPDRPLARVDCGGGSGGAGGPVVGLCHVAHTPAVDALVVCRLSSCTVLTLGPSQAESGFPMEDVAATARSAACSESVLPLAGPFTSLSVSEETGHVLVSARPSARQPHTTHAVCHLSAPASPPPSSAAATPPDDATTTTTAAAPAAGGGGGGGVEVDSSCAANVLRLVYGDTSQRLMSRSTLLPWPQRPDQLLVAAGQECSRSVQLWSVQSGAGVQRLAAGEPVLDVCSVMGGGQCGAAGASVAVLNEHRLAVYSWREKS